MKHLNHVRHYRNICTPGPDELSYQVVIEQSDLLIISRKDVRSMILDRLNIIRSEIKNYIYLNPDFSSSLIPIAVKGNSPDIIKDMAHAAELFGVGPMAAVAGAISQDIAGHVCKISPDILVENGGDIFIHSTKDRTVGLLPHPDEPVTLGIKISSAQTPCAICSSSATIGHSLSLGHGDLVAVRSKSGAVADAAATYICNMLHSRQALNRLGSMKTELQKKGVTGLMAQMGPDMLVWGNIELTMV